MTLQKEKSGIDFQKVLEFVNFLNINTDNYYSQSGHLTQSPHRLNMKVNFGGNVFNSVVNGKGIFREYVLYGEMRSLGWNVSFSEFHPKTKAMFIQKSNDYFVYDGSKGLSSKIKYAVDKNIGGFTTTEIDGGEVEGMFLETIANNPMCFLTDNVQYDCE